MILILQTVHKETKISAIDIDAVSILNIELYPFLRLYLTLQYSLYYQNKTTEDITHTHNKIEYSHNQKKDKNRWIS